MATNQSSMAAPPESPRDVYSQADDTTTVESSELLELLGDEYARRVLRAVADDSRTGRELVDTTDMSKATVYRRLNRLEDAGLVETSQLVDPDGNHRKQFHAVVESVDFEFGCEGVCASVETDNRSPGPTLSGFGASGAAPQSSD
jgi:DNA-binding transcriptional ArsR family regulator